MSHRLLVFAALSPFWLQLACKEDDEETKVSYKLKAEDLAAPSSTIVMDPFQMQFDLESRGSAFLATQADSSDVEVDPCIFNVLNSAPIKASGSALTFDLALDIGACFQESLKKAIPDVAMEIRKARVSFYFYTECSGVDLSSFNGKPFSQLETVECSSTGRLQSNTKTEFDVTYTTEGVTNTVVGTTFEATATLANEPCLLAVSATGESTYSNDCQTVTKSLISSPESYNEYLRLSYKDLTYVPSEANTWFTSGSFDLLLNNWTGSLTFSGPTAAPAYTMSNGVETITGVLTLPVSGLSLTKQISKTMNRSVDAALKQTQTK